MKQGIFSLDFLKEFIESGGLEIQKKKDKYNWVQDKVVDYVREGKVAEAKYLLQFDFENEMTDLNRLYGAALSNEAPEKVLRISVSKQSYQHRLLSPLHCACINPNP